jgi:hypothetical protein
MPRSLLLTIAALGATAAAATAQDRPPVSPTRDVTITYKVLGRQGAPTVQMSHNAASGLMRIDTPQMGGYAIIDRARKMSTMVMAQMRMYMEISAAQAPIGASPLSEDDARFTRKGTETIAGATCILWDVATPKGTGNACITADGAMLRFRTMAGDGLEATQVTYAPVPAANFAVPEGFQKMDMPAGGGMAGGGMPGGGMAPGMGAPQPR